MPHSRTGAGARSRRPARRGTRGGWRVRLEKGRGSGDQLTAPGVGVPDGPLRVGRQPAPVRQEPPAGAAAPHLGAEPGDGAGLRPVPRCLSRPPRLSQHETRRAGGAMATVTPLPNDYKSSTINNEKTINIGHSNVRSLIPKMDEILCTLVDQDLDILCITETWLTDSISDNILVFPGYKIIRRDRQTGQNGRRAHSNIGGGVAILHRDSLNCTVMPISTNDDTCESLWISVSGGGRRSATIGVMYRPPSQPLPGGLESIHDQLRSAIAAGRPVFCLGDFNIDVTRPLSAAARRYMSVLNDLNLFQLVDTPTHLEPSASLLDHIITSVPDLESAVSVLPVPIADHLTIILRAPFKRQRSRPAPFRARCWRKVDWNALSLYLLLSDWNQLYQAVDIDSKLEAFMRIWSSAIDIHCPLRTVTPRRSRCPWLEGNDELRQLMRERDLAFQVWRRTRTIIDRNNYRRLRNEVKNRCALSKRDFLCNSMISDRAGFWRGIREFALRSRPGSSGAELLSADRADDFNRHFALVGSNIASELAAASEGAPRLPPRPPLVTTAGLILRPITLPMLSKALNTLSPSRAVGHDGVPIFALRQCFAVLGPHLLHLINTSITKCVFPSDWKLASVVPLHKSGSHEVPGNFRPVSILPVLSKLCEKVVCQQLSEYLTSHSLLSPSQYAYRPCHSTEDAVTDAVEWITRRIDSGHIVAVTSIDLSKAFDSVDHDVLLSKLQWYGIDPQWFRSYLGGRRQVVRGGSLSLPLSHGVPQGSLVGPILFSIFTNDLSTYLPHGRLVSYADDTQLLDSDVPNNLSLLKTRQEDTLLSIQSYFTANSLKMNPTKTNLLLVGTSHAVNKASSFQLLVADHTLNPQPAVKMLGVTIDNTLSWEAHISGVVKKCNSVLFCIYKIRHHLTPDTRKLLIETHVFPYILYCITVWGGAASCHLNRVQKIINFAARIVSGARRYDSISAVVESLGWRRMRDLVTRRDCIGVYRALNDPRAPYAIRSLFTPRSEVSERLTRSVVAGALELPNFSLSMSRRAFSYRAASSWNRLLPATMASSSLAVLKSNI